MSRRAGTKGNWNFRGEVIGEVIMVKACSALAVLLLVTLLVPLAISAPPPPASDWLTWGYDQERSGWNRAETTLSKENVSGLVLQWSAQLPVPSREIALSTLTAPLVVEGVTTSQGRQTLVFVVGSDDSVFAIDADSGKVVWQKTFANTLTPPQIATWLCSNTQNATPVIVPLTRRRASSCTRAKRSSLAGFTTASRSLPPAKSSS